MNAELTDDVHARSDTGQGIGERELAVVHFMRNWRQHRVLWLVRWLVTSADIDYLMIIIFPMANGMLSATDSSGEPLVQVTVKRVIQGQTDYVYINQIFDATCALGDGSESAWSAVADCPWLNDEQMCLFDLVYAVSGCDFLAAIEKTEFLRLWNFSLKVLRTRDLFPTPVHVHKEGKFSADIEESGLQLLGLEDKMG